MLQKGYGLPKNVPFSRFIRSIRGMVYMLKEGITGVFLSIMRSKTVELVETRG